jgi:hypothetical protein
MVGGLHILIRNRKMKSLEVALSGTGRELRGRNGGGNLNNVQYKAIWNCHDEFRCATNIP